MLCGSVCCWPSVFSLNNLKLHETKAVQNVFTQEKFILMLTFNPGLSRVKAGVHMNRSEIWSNIKRELLGLKWVGNTSTLMFKDVVHL